MVKLQKKKKMHQKDNTTAGNEYASVQLRYSPAFRGTTRSAFLTVEKFNGNIDEKHVGKRIEEIATWPTCKNVLTSLQGL